MTKNRRFSVLGVFIALAILAFLPIVPCSLPEDEWHTSKFDAVKLEVEAVKMRLRHLENELQKASGNSRLSTYNLEGKYGEVHMLRSLLGSFRVGTYRHTTWSFGVPCLTGIPSLKYDHQNETAQVTPQNLAAFIEWAEHAEADTKAKSYTLPAHRQQTAPVVGK